jgi:hypothetical protein
MYLDVGFQGLGQFVIKVINVEIGKPLKIGIDFNFALTVTSVWKINEIHPRVFFNLAAQ